MNPIPPELYNLLLRSLDAELSPHEAQQLQTALENNEALRIQQQQMLQMRALLAGQQYHFNPGFEDRVMDAINQLQTEGNSRQVDFGTALTLTFRRIALSGVAAILVLLFITYLNYQSLSLNAITGIENLNPEDVELYYIVDL
ncbi:hypothetical protein C7N43_00205 [Sphingobacteriales bacterium UPWRP_1]|nr:hypothetical protein BVG80_15135 [Sphingobacteriales bacterium TSM_CSM]PSJ79083.1 hypothetical protein C7N43_00205 [Sphingobacteriales bacterium UPWRP_1]